MFAKLQSSLFFDLWRGWGERHVKAISTKLAKSHEPEVGESQALSQVSVGKLSHSLFACPESTGDQQPFMGGVPGCILLAWQKFPRNWGVVPASYPLLFQQYLISVGGGCPVQRWSLSGLCIGEWWGLYLSPVVWHFKSYPSVVLAHLP